MVRWGGRGNGDGRVNGDGREERGMGGPGIWRSGGRS
jgi:hypothetical protein